MNKRLTASLGLPIADDRHGRQFTVRLTTARRSIPDLQLALPAIKKLSMSGQQLS
jgi:hypothetical protein